MQGLLVESGNTSGMKNITIQLEAPPLEFLAREKAEEEAEERRRRSRRRRRKKQEEDEEW